MSTSQKNNKTKQYIHRVLFFTFDPELLETSINFCNQYPEEEIKNKNDFKKKIEEKSILTINNNKFNKKNEEKIIETIKINNNKSNKKNEEKIKTIRINNNNFFEKNHNTITEFSSLNLQYEYTKKLSDNLPNNNKNSKSSKNIENTRTNKKNYKTKSNILSYKSKILRYLNKYDLAEKVKEDMNNSMKNMENIMKDNDILYNINKHFKNNNIEDIFKILKENNKYIKYCLIIDEEKSIFSHSIIRRKTLYQEGGQRIRNIVNRISNIFNPFVIIIYFWISYNFSYKNKEKFFSIFSVEKKKTHYPKM